MNRKLSKRILSGVTALLMVSGTVPANFSSISFGSFSITASAEQETSHIFRFTPKSSLDLTYIYFYYWKGSSDYAAWPGQKMTKNSDGSFEFEVPAEQSPENFILNDGKSFQTDDMKLNASGDVVRGSTKYGTYTYEEKAEAVYIVAGSESALFGMAWDATNQDNKLTVGEDGKLSKTFTVEQAYDNVELKVVKKEGSFDPEWLGGSDGNNVVFSLKGAGEFTVTIDPATNEITVTGSIVKYPAVASGTCGAAAAWELDSNGTLTISGSGEFNYGGWDKSAVKNIIIEDGLTYISNYTFEKSTNLESVTIPDTVYYVGCRAFADCTALTEITIPKGVTECDAEAFKGCIAMKKANILTTQFVDRGIYLGLDNDKKPLEGFTMVCQVFSYGYDYAKYYKMNCECTPASGKCGDDIEWTLTEDGTLTLTGTGDIYYFEEARSQWDLREYGGLDYTPYIKKVIIGEGITIIASCDFIGCSNLESVTLPETLVVIDCCAFENCSSLKSIDLPEGLMTVWDDAFKGTGISEITIPKSVEHISYNDPFPAGCKLYVYYDSKGAEYAIENGYDYEYVDVMATGSCGAQGDNVKWRLMTDGTLYISGEGEMDNDEWQSQWDRREYGGSDYTPYIKKAVIGEGITYIGSCDFIGCSNLESVTLPETLETIEYCAFENCTALKDIYLPDGVKSIGNGVFFGSGIKEISIPKDVERIGYDDPFPADCKLYVYFASKGEEYAIEKGHEYDYYGLIAAGNCGDNGDNVKAWLTDEGTLYIRGEGGMAENPLSVDNLNLEVKKAIIGEGVTKISKNAFKNCKNMTEITIPDSVTEISDFALNGCTELTEIDLPDYLKTIGFGAFGNCEKLGNIAIPASVNKIDDMAFNGCTSLKEIVLPEGLETIGSFTFGYCTNLEKVVIPDSVKEIKMYAFTSCEKLTEIKLPNNLEVIGPNAFALCINLKEIEIPESIKTIESGAFACCQSLTEIKLPDGTESINEDVFAACTNLKKIDIPDSVKSIKDTAFVLCTSFDDFTIPETVTDIGERSFYNMKLKSITIPKTVKTIGNRAFGYCYNEDFEYNENYDNGDDMFKKIDGFKIYCFKNSAGEQYAIDNGIEYELIHIEGKAVKENEVPATCTKDGSYDLVVYCTDCGVELSRETKVIKAKGHQWGEWKVTKEATFDEEGEETRECSCGEKETRSIPKLTKPEDDKPGKDDTTTDDDTTDEETSSDETLIGDINGDGSITVTDISLLAAHVKGKRSLDDDAYARADTNGDGQVNITDVSKIAAHVKGKRALNE